MANSTVIAEKKKIEQLVYLISIGKVTSIDTDKVYNYLSSFNFSGLDEVQWTNGSPSSLNGWAGHDLMSEWNAKVINPVADYWYNNATNDMDKYVFDELYSVAMCERNEL